MTECICKLNKFGHGEHSNLAIIDDSDGEDIDLNLTCILLDKVSNYDDNVCCWCEYTSCEMEDFDKSNDNDNDNDKHKGVCVPIDINSFYFNSAIEHKQK